MDQYENFRGNGFGRGIGVVLGLGILVWVYFLENCECTFSCCGVRVPGLFLVSHIWVLGFVLPLCPL